MIDKNLIIIKKYSNISKLINKSSEKNGKMLKSKKTISKDKTSEISAPKKSNLP
jgi:hypothetical protein